MTDETNPDKTAGTEPRDTVALLGGGKMGEALLAGMVRAGHTVLVAEKHEARAAELAERYDVTTTDAASAVAGADLVVVAVKPGDIRATLRSVADRVTPSTVVVSVAAGISAADLEATLPDGSVVVRVMPNTPALVGQGMSALAPGTHADEVHLDRAETVLRAVGRVARVTEDQLDAVTGLSGSGPAYVFAFAEAMIDSGVCLGLPRPLATELVVQTIAGAGVMLQESGQSATELREAVTSPGGTTAAALRAFDERALRATVATAVEACARRSRELGAS